MPTWSLLLIALAACLEPKPRPIDSAPPPDGDGDGAGQPADCDDADPEVYPGAAERCDGLDQDCDEQVDEGAQSSFYADSDGDGYGDTAAVTAACAAPSGSVATGGDCDDADPTSYPGAAERCEGADNDCDSQIDESVLSTWYLDRDLDGHGDPAARLDDCDPPAGAVATGDDCDDGEPAAFPGNPEACEGLDNDCDGAVDEGVTTPWWLDLDADGYGDVDFPVEACGLPNGYAANPDDCDDSDATVSPGAAERCGGADEDCDGTTDEPTAIDALSWYSDADGDGYGDPATAQVQCAQPTGHVPDDQDCDDGDAAVSPGHPETCDGRDDDCDQQIDESGATDAATWFTDGDGDGFGDPAAPLRACAQPTGAVADDSDCEDGDPLAYPGSHATETPLDGVDQDCDGLDACTDLSCDGYPDLLLVGHYDGDYATSAWIYPYNNGFSDGGRLSLPSYGAWDSEVADFNNDGYLDIFLPTYHNGSTHSGDSYVYWGSAAGYSTSNRTGISTAGASGTLAEDLNNDGYIDLVIASYYSGSSYTTNNYVVWGSGSGFSNGNRTALSATGARSVAAADFNSDGYTDLAFCSYYNGSSYSLNSPVFWGSSSGYSTANRTDLPTVGCHTPNAGDVNADGYPDLILTSHYSGSSYVSTSKIWYASAAGFSSAYTVSLSTNGAISSAISDVNLDGFNDVVVSGYFASAWNQPIYTYTFTGSALGLSSSVYTALDISGVVALRVEDIDGDGWDDLFVVRLLDGTTYNVDSYVYWGGAGGWSAANRDALPGQGAYGGDIGDIDGDGYAEVLVGGYNNSGSGTWPSTAASFVYWGSASGYSASARTTLGATGVYAPPHIVGAW